MPYRERTGRDSAHCWTLGRISFELLATASRATLDFRLVQFPDPARRRGAEIDPISRLASRARGVTVNYRAYPPHDGPSTRRNSVRIPRFPSSDYIIRPPSDCDLSLGTSFTRARPKPRGRGFTSHWVAAKLLAFADSARSRGASQWSTRDGFCSDVFVFWKEKKWVIAVAAVAATDRRLFPLCSLDMLERAKISVDPLRSRKSAWRSVRWPALAALVFSLDSIGETVSRRADGQVQIRKHARSWFCCAVSRGRYGSEIVEGTQTSRCYR